MTLTTLNLGTKKEGNSLVDQDKKAAAAQHSGRSICQPRYYDYFLFCVTYRVNFHANSSS